LQGFDCVHVESALAYDEMPSNEANELKARVRMTSKNFLGTLGRWGVQGFFRRPVLSWVILSHKYGRWITPWLLLLTLLTSVTSLLQIGGPMLVFIVSAQVVFYALGLAGWLKISLPLAGSIYSFLLANYGMFLGVVKVIKGEVKASYTPIRNEPVKK